MLRSPPLKKHSKTLAIYRETLHLPRDSAQLFYNGSLHKERTTESLKRGKENQFGQNPTLTRRRLLEDQVSLWEVRFKPQFRHPSSVVQNVENKPPWLV